MPARSLLPVFLMAANHAQGATEPTHANLEFFERKVRPLFAEHCFSCHGAEKQKGGLRLDSPEFIRAGGDGGPVLSPGSPNESLIVAVGYQDEGLKMPPKNRLAMGNQHVQTKILSPVSVLNGRRLAPYSASGTKTKRMTIRGEI
jgi:hypothetical protein